MRMRSRIMRIPKLLLTAGLFGSSSGALADGPDLVAYFKNTNGIMRMGQPHTFVIGVKNNGNRATPSGTCIRVDLTVSYSRISSFSSMGTGKSCDGNSFALQGRAGCQITDSNKLSCEWDGLSAKDLPGDSVYSNDAWEIEVTVTPTRTGGTSFKVEADRPNRIREDGRETNIGVIPMTIR